MDAVRGGAYYGHSQEAYPAADWTMADLKFAAECGDEAARAEFVARGGALYTWCPECGGLRVWQGMCQDCAHECE